MSGIYAYPAHFRGWKGYSHRALFTLVSQFLIVDCDAVFSEDDFDVGISLWIDFDDRNTVAAVAIDLDRLGTAFEAECVFLHSMSPSRWKDVFHEFKNGLFILPSEENCCLLHQPL